MTSSNIVYSSIIVDFFSIQSSFVGVGGIWFTIRWKAEVDEVIFFPSQKALNFAVKS